MELIAGIFGGALAVACVVAGVEMCRYIRRRLPPPSGEVANQVAQELANGLAEADFERAERRGKLYTQKQKADHIKALRGRIKLGIDKYETACRGGTP